MWVISLFRHMRGLNGSEDYIESVHHKFRTVVGTLLVTYSVWKYSKEKYIIHHRFRRRYECERADQLGI